MRNLKEAVLHAYEITKENKGHIIRSEQMSRGDRELLVKTGWFQEVIKGWYLCFISVSCDDLIVSLQKF